MFRRGEGQKPDKRNLHSQQGSKNVEDIVGRDDLIEFLHLMFFMGNQGEKDKDGNDVDDEGVASPRCHHVEVGKC